MHQDLESDMWLVGSNSLRCSPTWMPRKMHVDHKRQDLHRYVSWGYNILRGCTKILRVTCGYWAPIAWDVALHECLERCTWTVRDKIFRYVCLEGSDKNWMAAGCMETNRLWLAAYSSRTLFTQEAW